ncbi:MmgE/PrpD family protein [Bradyrhizobium sp. KB893862 SZCCT0404]|uniref:MmgE/PrpD family protein n=1 Tax=Bradyrhizobium sp. KB893862 SZCCT0404 TaxID=2807672 RepID=UPI001BAB3EFD|nr:MmgE/PrpD family protein [Bradyrhizobium sp. KB893862 SZCCT0404]MBR1175291.1 MmgE/PrpD family protein [Bradyrhizobium sp. KB893862 SZCCT0404]
MSGEQAVTDFVCRTELEAFPETSRAVVKHIVLAVIGSAMAGASEEGCREVQKYVLESGGKSESSVFFTGAKAPARSAALANGVVCRALDYCDAMAPGLHMGSSIVPVALAMAESIGGCSGRDLLAAIAVGAEVGARFNLSEAEYHGFDPTGVAGVFAATAVACRMRRLPPHQTLHALALAFNRAGGSFQSNVDGSLAVRVIQGWVAESGVLCAELAAIGITGPSNFLEGVYGYRRLFAGDAKDDRFTRELGRDFRLDRTVFKQFPSCGLTQGITQLTVEAVQKHGVGADQMKSIVVRVPPYAHKLVGHPFVIGENPRVNAQFSIQFCVANALLHGSSELNHFTPEAVGREAIMKLASVVEAKADPTLDARGHTAVDLDITTGSGELLSLKLDHPDGFPDSPLSATAHMRRFEDCVRYSKVKNAQVRGQAIAKMIENLEDVADARQLVNLLTTN